MYLEEQGREHENVLINRLPKERDLMKRRIERDAPPPTKESG